MSMTNCDSCCNHHQQSHQFRSQSSSNNCVINSTIENGEVRNSHYDHHNDHDNDTIPSSTSTTSHLSDHNDHDLFNDLSDDILLYIFKYVADIETLQCLLQVNYKVRNILRNTNAYTYIWFPLCQQYWSFLNNNDSNNNSHRHNVKMNNNYKNHNKNHEETNRMFALSNLFSITSPTSSSNDTMTIKDSNKKISLCKSSTTSSTTTPIMMKFSIDKSFMNIPALCLKTMTKNSQKYHSKQHNIEYDHSIGSSWDNSEQYSDMTLGVAHSNSNNILKLNLPYLLSLSSKYNSIQIDEQFFIPTRLNRLFREHRPINKNAIKDIQYVTLRKTNRNKGLSVLKNEGSYDNEEFETAIQYIGNTNASTSSIQRCIRSDQPLCCPHPMNMAHIIQHEYKQKKSSLWSKLFSNRFKRKNKVGSNQYNNNNPDNTTNNIKSSLKGTDNDIDICIFRPFVTPFAIEEWSEEVNRYQKTIQLTPRLVSYYEVSIRDPKNIIHGHEHEDHNNDNVSPITSITTNDHQEENNNDSYIAIGIGTKDFNLCHHLPGCDTNSESFGYHGNDGSIYYSSSDSTIVVNTKYGSKFNMNDTIGCGIDYNKRSIFFTLNGIFNGYAFSNISLWTLNKNDLYPLTGIQTSTTNVNLPIICNFGTNISQPFKFNLNEYIRSKQYNVIINTLKLNNEQQIVTNTNTKNTLCNNKNKTNQHVPMKKRTNRSRQQKRS